MLGGQDVDVTERSGQHRGRTKTLSRVENPAHTQRQIVLVFQGGGALGAYQAGVYKALH